MSVKKTENVFSEALLEKLFLHTRDGKAPNKTNFFNWGSNVIGVSNAIFVFDLPEELKKEVETELLNKNIFEQVPKKWFCSVFLMSRHSNIPWHNDEKYKFTCTIYLNKEWDSNHGGYFMYEDGEELKAIIPTYNNAVSFAPPLKHTSVLTSNYAPLRESLQIFVEEF